MSVSRQSFQSVFLGPAWASRHVAAAALGRFVSGCGGSVPVRDLKALYDAKLRCCFLLLLQRLRREKGRREKKQDMEEIIVFFLFCLLL